MLRARVLVKIIIWKVKNKICFDEYVNKLNICTYIPCSCVLKYEEIKSWEECETKLNCRECLQRFADPRKVVWSESKREGKKKRKKEEEKK